MLKLLALIAAAALLTAPSRSAKAEPSEAANNFMDLEAISRGADSLLDGVSPWAGVVTSSSGRPGWSVLNFYAYKVNGSLRLRARLTQGAFLKAGTEVVADGQTCPALRAVMLEAERVKLAPLHNSLLDGGSRIIILDGVRYRLWGDADGPMARIEVSESDGGAVSAYVKHARAALQDCWTKGSTKP
jgi:hypothetical protein